VAVLALCQAPDPVLRRKTRRVRTIDASLRQLIRDMIETMHHAQGVGLAANQVGVPLRLAVIGMPDEEEIRVLINPEVVRRVGEREVEEGCLSIPGYRGTLRRSVKIRVKALDQEGKEFRVSAENDLLAQALEHEIDHLNGTLYIDHLESPERLYRIPLEEEPQGAGEGAAGEG